MYNLLYILCVYVCVFYIITTVVTKFQHVEFSKRGDTYFSIDINNILLIVFRLDIRRVGFLESVTDIGTNNSAFALQYHACSVKDND